MTLNLYIFTGPEIKIAKTLPTPTVVSGDRVEGNQDVTAPSFIISSASVPNYNYAYVPDLGRYYFIDRVTWIADSLWRLNLRVDVLKTYSAKISLLSAPVRYSNLGSTAITDSRVGMESVISSVLSASNITDHYYFVLKYWDVAAVTHTPSYNYKLTPQIAFLSPRAFSWFWEAYKDLSKDERVIVGNAIIDVSIVHYMNNLSTIAAVTGTHILKFMTANAANEVSIDIFIDSDDPPTADDYAWIISNPNEVPNLGYRLYDTGATWTDGYFWNGAAKWHFMLPYAGNLDIVPNETGYYSITYFAIQVKYEPYENAYILTPFINEGLETQATVAIPVPTTFAFPVDSSFENLAGSTIASLLGSAGSVAGGIATLAMTGNPMGIIPITTGVTSAVNNIVDLGVKQNMVTTKYTGPTGGVPGYTGTPDPSKIYWHRQAAIPRPGYTDLWTNFGKPDGAFRALSGLTGYYQLSDVTLTNMGEATSSERNEIRNLLTSGVIA